MMEPAGDKAGHAQQLHLATATNLQVGHALRRVCHGAHGGCCDWQQLLVVVVLEEAQGAAEFCFGVDLLTRGSV
jgi:hypothetical protein